MSLPFVIAGKPTDLGGFSVRRLLPVAKKRALGPFVFFDHMGPAEFPPGKGIMVRPHPHIGLATLTYLFQGRIRHRDSLGYVQDIEPGAVNWMTAGRGIVHSERASPIDLAQGQKLDGIQTWIALPRAAEEVEPDFTHYSSAVIPAWKSAGIQYTLVAGRWADRESPVKTHSPLTYIDAHAMAAGACEINIPQQELGVYLAHGSLTFADGEKIAPGSLAIFAVGEKIAFSLSAESRVIILGGEPLPEKREIWWNFVATSKEKIADAKLRWKKQEFGQVPGEVDFIPLPEDESH